MRGKTLMGLHFLFNGVSQGTPGLFASLQEDSQQLERVAAGFGWSFEDAGLEVTHSSPVDIYLDEWVYELLDRAERTGAKRIVVDSIDDLAFAISDTVRFRECLYSLSRRCAPPRDLPDADARGTRPVRHGHGRGRNERLTPV